MPDQTPPDIEFISEDVDFQLNDSENVALWLQEIALQEDREIAQLTYVFCSDEYLLKLNQDYLQHDTFTDVITFDYSEHSELIEGDFFISIPRIRENAKTYEASFTDELHRVMAHGLLHLMGYDDKTPAFKGVMRAKEDECLSLRNFSGE
jgi:probable rRNA maturation factor